MLVGFRELLDERRAQGAAVGAFTCYDVTTALAVVRAAEQNDAPVIFLVSEASFRGVTGRLLVEALVAIASEARVPATVQLDHVRDSRLIDAALATRFGAVMADGSKLVIEENIRFVSAVGSCARQVGVEAELGHIAGEEDVATAAESGALTDPQEAARFVAATNCDCLAVSIGNVHGRYARPAQLDWNRLSSIRNHVEIPLSLHGASGIPDADLRRAVSLGICKVNINTELREAYFECLDGRLATMRNGLRILELEAEVIDAISRVVAAKLSLLE